MACTSSLAPAAGGPESARSADGRATRSRPVRAHHATHTVRLRSALYLAVVGSILAVAAGCAVPGGESAPVMSLARDLPADTTLLLPATRPPNLTDAGLSSGNDTPIVSFYSLNEPIVSVCQATQEQCLSLLPTATVISRSDIGPDVTVLIEAGENGVVPLSDELARYWAQVDFVAGRPTWLGAP